MAARITRRALLTAGTAGPPVFVIVFLAEGATRDRYDWLRHPVSDLTALTFRRRRRAPA